MEKLTAVERHNRKSLGAIHAHFGLSYASYLVVPRLALQEMPLDWQERFVGLLNEAYEQHDLAAADAVYDVRRRGDNGQLMSDPFKDYRHCTVEQARALDARLSPQT